MSTSWQDLSEPTNEETPRTNLLIVDGNNAAYRYIQRKNYNDFTDDYIRTIESLGKSYGAKKTIVCFDYGKSYYRMAISDDYKSTRKKPKEPEEIQKYEEFFECLNKTIAVLPFPCYKIRGVEADDLITFFVKKYWDAYDHTWIISSDRDLYQLLRENVSIFNLFSRKEINLDYLTDELGLTPELYKFSRYLEGDVSDAIIGIEGIGPKRAQDLVKKYKTLDNLLKSLPIKGKSQYINNLNAGKEIIIKNEKMINLLDYNEIAIKSSAEGEEFLKNETTN